MDGVADGVVGAVFGVVLTTGHYEACRGQLEFRGGLLVGVQFGRHQQWSGHGLTVGLTLFPVPAVAVPGAGDARARAVARVYSCGALGGETDLGE
jgi:hypothetical protein